MGISIGLVLVAAGAVLTWAVEVDVSGVNITTMGVILMVVGIVGMLFSLAFWSSWGGFGGRPTVARERERTIVRDEQQPL